MEGPVLSKAAFDAKFPSLLASAEQCFPLRREALINRAIKITHLLAQLGDCQRRQDLSGAPSDLPANRQRGGFSARRA